MQTTYEALKSRWRAGERDRELGLQLMFFSWMHWADPPFVTGLTEDPEAGQLWRDVFAYMGGEDSADVEFLFVGGLMAGLVPYALGDEAEWAVRGSRMKKRAIELRPLTYLQGAFDDRGEYGEYFSHQLRGHLRAH